MLPDEPDLWHLQRKAEMELLSIEIGLPLEQNVHIELVGGVELSGLLQLDTDDLFLLEARPKTLHLRVGRTVFSSHEVVSCVQTG